MKHRNWIYNLFHKRFLSPIYEFINDSRAVGILLLVCTLLSLFISNTSLGAGYILFWQKSFHYPSFISLPHSILHWINDGLMALFFLLAGMEIKRELLVGELSSFKKSIMPVAGAFGGMVVPALIFFLFNMGTKYSGGWGIPMATDIAFSLGVASLLGNRFSVSLKIFLMALAIIDDLGAILVIALFYGGDLNSMYLLVCLGAVLIILLLNRLKVKFGIIHFLLGIVLWYGMFNSGIHASVAGVVFAFLVPVTLLSKYENKLHDWVNFIILALFALANTAILLPPDFALAINNNLSWGIIAGLFLGKPLGILLACWLLVTFKWGQLPVNTGWKQITGLGMLAGIGFTMSIFISALAFKDPDSQNIAKIAVLLASFLCILTGLAWFRLFSSNKKK
jgi:Na+:H+ antiporter, NhaA family